jgi:hypothetical protein
MHAALSARWGTTSLLSLVVLFGIDLKWHENAALLSRRHFLHHAMIALPWMTRSAVVTQKLPLWRICKQTESKREIVHIIH